MREGICERGYLCKSAFTALFSPHYPPDLAGSKKWVREEQISPGFSVFPIFLPQPNNGKQHFPPYFPLSIFNPPCFHPNQMHPYEKLNTHLPDPFVKPEFIPTKLKMEN